MGEMGSKIGRMSSRDDRESGVRWNNMGTILGGGSRRGNIEGLFGVNTL